MEQAVIVVISCYSVSYYFPSEDRNLFHYYVRASKDVVNYDVHFTLSGTNADIMILLRNYKFMIYRSSGLFSALCESRPPSRRVIFHC